MSSKVNSGEEITLQQAQDLIAAFKTRFPNQIKAQFVSSDNVQLILNQPDCAGIRMYYGYDEKETSHLSLVFVGVDSAGTDMTEGIIMDRFKICPTMCDPTSELF